MPGLAFREHHECTQSTKRGKAHVSDEGQELQANEGGRRTFAISLPASVYRFVNSICMGCIGSFEADSFDDVIREVSPCVREEVTGIRLMLIAGVVAPDKLPKGDAVPSAKEG